MPRKKRRPQKFQAIHLVFGLMALPVLLPLAIPILLLKLLTGAGRG
jgi:hypothetical protein